jgi:REP-associated tyrosine transposase
MGRALRPQFEDAIYHVTVLGNRRSAIFVDDDDRLLFLGFLGNVVRRMGWELHSWCLMTSHYHLSLTTPAANIARGMHLLNCRHARLFNDRHGYEGHVFKGRYGSRVVESESHLLGVYRYIALNPVRAGICERPEDWPWGSYRFLVRGEPSPLFAPLALDAFGEGPAAVAELRRYVERGE